MAELGCLLFVLFCFLWPLGGLGNLPAAIPGQKKLPSLLWSLPSHVKQLLLPEREGKRITARKVSWKSCFFTSLNCSKMEPNQIRTAGDWTGTQSLPYVWTRQQQSFFFCLFDSPRTPGIRESGWRIITRGSEVYYCGQGHVF